MDLGSMTNKGNGLSNIGCEDLSRHFANTIQSETSTGGHYISHYQSQSPIH